MSRYQKNMFKAYSFGTMLAAMLVASVAVALIEMEPILSSVPLN